ncbi:threonine-phosphate decarboxylase CobD [Salipaludibacillus aurantiacus]|uniref:threonine-phosphate decarboxylase n=1 Tax=Salipaludibacillus aurantiacus TaxID=1601833 RepID=A0A1H9SFU5_9BACI|nr:threonine-phosphate decarboxylase CobD [Salipaludibacillus aurantiacus]SER83253.1 threonine-phosphate decarboxylase [Salipaludibacillus aurantiacus]
MNWPKHGGQPDVLHKQFNLSKGREILDFSANIHPGGPPSFVTENLRESIESIARYPDPDYGEARSHIAAFNSTETDQVLITNGGAEAVFLAAKYFEGKRALIVEPTFLEYERACGHYHLEVKPVFLRVEEEFHFPLDQVLDELAETEVVFICRPNNPSGTVVSEADIRILLEKGKETGTFLVIDEAFADFLPKEEGDLTPLLNEFSNLILLRSLTKMFAVPGVRAGYMLGAPEVIRAVREWQMPWSVNSFASSLIPVLAGEEAAEFAAASSRYVKGELERIRLQLSSLDFDMSPSSVNFYLLRDRRDPGLADELLKFLLKKGIAARHTHNFNGLDGKYLRFAVLDKPANDQLLEKLAEWRDN